MQGRRVLRAALLSLAICAAYTRAVAHQVPELLAIEARIQLEAKAKVEEPYKAGLSNVTSAYLTALDRERERLKQAGHVKEALALENERASVGEGKAVPARDGAEVPVELRKLRATYRADKHKLDQGRANRIQPIVDGYRRDVETLVNNLRRERRLADVQAARDSANTFAKRLLARPAIIVGNGQGVPFKSGAKAYANRSYVWTHLTPPLADLTFIPNSGGSYEAKEVKVREPGMVYIAVDASRAADHEALQDLGFVSLAQTFAYNDRGRTKMALFAKLAEGSFDLPQSTSWTGFVVIGDIR